MSLSFETVGNESQAILRFLNGPLCGCEYRLRSGATLIVSGDDRSLLGDEAEAGVPDFPENVIVVPLAGGENFEIMVEGDAEGEFLLRTFIPDVIEKSVAYQERCSVGSLEFSVRPIGTSWHAEVTAVDFPVSGKTGHPKQSWLMPATFIAIVVSVLVVMSWLLWNMFNENKHVAEVAAVIEGSSKPYILVRGQDGKVYIFAQTERDVSWAKQALTRERMAGSASITTIQAEEARINRLVIENYPQLAFFRMRLSDPVQPKLLLSLERSHLNTEREKVLLAKLTEWMPYAKTVVMNSWSDAMLDEKAQSGLHGLQVAYDRAEDANGVTYQVHGNLSDIELARLDKFIAGFYRDFGERYVSFAVVLKEDWLKGKSFRYGGAGYVKMNPQHWFFPQRF